MCAIIVLYQLYWLVVLVCSLNDHHMMFYVFLGHILINFFNFFLGTIAKQKDHLWRH